MVYVTPPRFNSLSSSNNSAATGRERGKKRLHQLIEQQTRWKSCDNTTWCNLYPPSSAPVCVRVTVCDRSESLPGVESEQPSCVFIDPPCAICKCPQKKKRNRKKQQKKRRTVTPRVDSGSVLDPSLSLVRLGVFPRVVNSRGG